MFPIHPIVVHFPVALCITALLFYAIAFLLKKENFEIPSLVLHLLGLAGCIAAVLSGEMAEESIRETPAVEAILERHETLGMVSAWAFGILGIWPLLRLRASRLAERLVFLAAYTAAAVVLTIGAHQGGRMVYEQGAVVASAPGGVPAPAADQKHEEGDDD